MPEVESRSSTNGWRMIRDGMDLLLRGGRKRVPSDRDFSPDFVQTQSQKGGLDGLRDRDLSTSWGTTPDKDQGWDGVRPVDVNVERVELIKHNQGQLTKVQVAVEVEEKKQGKTERSRVFGAGLSLIAIGALLWFGPGIAEWTGPKVQSVISSGHELFNHTEKDRGIKSSVELLKNGPKEIYDNYIGAGILDVKPISPDVARNHEDNLLGFQYGLNHMINQDFAGLDKYTTEPQFLIDYEKFAQGKPKISRTLIEFLKMKFPNPTLRPGETKDQYWQRVNDGIEEIRAYQK